MSSIIGKQFENRTNGEVVKVVSIDGNIAILENDQRISVERLLDNNHYGEARMNQSGVNQSRTMVNESTVVDNNMNDNSLHSQLFQQIQGLSQEDIQKAQNSGGVAQIEQGKSINPVESHHEAQARLKGENVYDEDSPDTKAMLERAKKQQLELNKRMKSQSDKFSKTSNMEGIDEEVTIPVNRNLEGVKYEGQVDDSRDTSVSMVEDVGSNVPGRRSPQSRTQKKEPEVNPMFTKMKRTKKVTLKIDIEEMMPSKDLLKMLEEGFEDSVLDYLTEEIAGKVLTDKVIKSQIRKKIHEYVYGKPRATRKKTSTAKKSTAKKSPAKKTTDKSKTSDK